MLKDVEWAKDGTYIPGEEFSPERFFNDGLKNSCSFDLQLGYFSSATISVLAEGFATFIANEEQLQFRPATGLFQFCHYLCIGRWLCYVYSKWWGYASYHQPDCF